MNVTTYGFTIACAHILGPTDYGALAAWMNLLLVVNVGFLGLQATAARRLSSGEHRSTTSSPTWCGSPWSPRSRWAWCCWR